MPDIVILTDSRYETPTETNWYINNILHEEELIQRALETRGCSVERVDWARAKFDWASPDAAIFRSTWDYFERFNEFSDWLDRVQNQTQLINSAKQVRWNLDKHYLLDLESRGVRIVPTLIQETGTTRSLSEWLAESGFDEAILKPAVSGAARHTYRINQANTSDYAALLNDLLKHEAMMLQPFQENVLQSGEISLMVLDGKFTHSVQKIAKPGDFRVQDDHGGTVHEYLPKQREIDFAEEVFAACDPLPAYGRVDIVTDNDGHSAVMELELVEPELWFRFHPAAAADFADAVVRRLKA